MGSGKPKQFTRPPPKKKPAKAAALDTIDDFQEAADFEESAGGKHRAGDPVKSGRAFLRALDLYDKGLQKHPDSFDLAYNKARLQLELSQQPVLVEPIGVELVDWLQQTLESHRYALTLAKENPDVLFNTAQVLSSLAEQFIEDDRESEAPACLREALELLSVCLSMQEKMYEQHKLDFPDTEDGGVSLDPTTNDASASGPDAATDVDMDEEQSAVVEAPISPTDLLDTVHASLSALTTLAPLSDEAGLGNLGEMARHLSELKAPDYIALLPRDDQSAARFSLAVARAAFIAAYASAQFEHHLIELQTYVERLDAFDIPDKESSSEALVAEAEARTELVLSTLDRIGESPDLPVTLCWKQLAAAQDLYTQATKLTTEEAQESKADTYKSKGDLELLRHRLTLIPGTDLAESVRNSAKTLIQNAQTFYKGAVSHAKVSGDEDIEDEAQQRKLIAQGIAMVLYGGDAPKVSDEEELREALDECVEEGLISQQLQERLLTAGQAASRS
jgi:tetratricopeptide (TPR) repeat protein